MALALVHLIKVKFKPSALWGHIKWTCILLRPRRSLQNTRFWMISSQFRPPCGFDTWWGFTRSVWHEFLTGHSGSSGREDINGQTQLYLKCECGRRFLGAEPGIYKFVAIKEG